MAEALSTAYPEEQSYAAYGPNLPEAIFDLEIYMAFQPLINTSSQEIVSYEALVRGPSGRSEATVMARVTPENQFDFDRKCRVTAIETAAALEMSTDLSINFMPSAVEDPEDFLEQLQWTADEFDFPVDRIFLEYSELDRPTKMAHLKEICRLTRRTGIRTVIDDFGAGQASLLRLATLRPAMLKLDQAFVRKVDADPRRRAVIAGLQAVCLDLDISLVAKGVETLEEIDALRGCGVDLFQGNFFAPATLEHLHQPSEIMFARQFD